MFRKKKKNLAGCNVTCNGLFGKEGIHACVCQNLAAWKYSFLSLLLYLTSSIVFSPYLHPTFSYHGGGSFGGILGGGSGGGGIISSFHGYFMPEPGEGGSGSENGDNEPVEIVHVLEIPEPHFLSGMTNMGLFYTY